MNLKKMMSLKFYFPTWKQSREFIEYDKRYNMAFRGMKKMTFEFKRSPEWKTIVVYRKCQSNKDNIWKYFYEHKLNRLSLKTGIDFGKNYSIGRGLIIGHWGRIILNGNAVFGSELLLSHNVNVGRDIRGKRAGSPTFGNRVCIRGGAIVVGNIHIGNDVLIAPGAFVNFDVPDHSIVIGNPGKIHHSDNATEGHLPSI